MYDQKLGKSLNLSDGHLRVHTQKLMYQEDFRGSQSKPFALEDFLAVSLMLLLKQWSGSGSPPDNGSPVD